MSAQFAHDDRHAEALALYALGALPAEEAARLASHVAACADCRREIDGLGLAVDALAASGPDVLQPSPSLRDHLRQRITEDTGLASTGTTGDPWVEPEWTEAATGVWVKLLATDTEKQRVSMLVRLAPRTHYPAHRHEGVEELHLLDGELIVDDDTYYPGAYRRVESGTIDHRIYSETGCTCVLITSYRDEIL